MHGFNHSYQNLLNLFNILNTIMIIFELILKRRCMKRCTTFKYYDEMRLKPQINLTKFN